MYLHELALFISFGQMKKSTFLFFGLILVLGLFSCRKEEPRDIQDVWLPKELKDMFLFYPGSYWVMELPGTDFVDSVFVDSTRIDTLPIIHPGSRDTVAYKERLSVRYVSPFYGWYYTFITESKDYCEIFLDGGPCHRVRRILQNGDLALVGQTYVYHFPEALGQKYAAASSFTDNQVRIDSVLTTYSQADSIYQNVRKVIVDRDVTQQNQVSVRHFAPGVGLIRWQVPEFGFNWICVRYGVKQQPD